MWSRVVLVGLLVGSRAAVGVEASADLVHLSLEELASVEVSTVSKVPETLWRVPAAVYVISGDDIRRSGATSLPDALRLAPGVEVAQIDAGHWAVGIRGFGDQFSKSVLVLIDGRSVYTPLFAGVYWAVQDTILEDVDRIEVIRGPGGTVWGANAVNGVINVITKSARETAGALAAFGAGNAERSRDTLRYGAASNDRAYRVYGQYVRHAAGRHQAGDPDFDDWSHSQGGFRADWLARESDSVSVHGDVYSGSLGQSVQVGSFAPPQELTFHQPLALSGGNLMARWQRQLGAAGELDAQSYYDRTRYSGPQFRETRDTFDLDLIHHRRTARQEIVAGLGARISPSRFEQTVPGLDFLPRSDTQRLFSAFIQDTIAIRPDRVSLTLGSKFEHNDDTGLETQPSIRLLWTPRDHLSIWSSISRAVRTPSRIERDFRLSAFLAANPPTYLEVAGNPSFQSERLIAYEIGLRELASSTFYVELAAFHNEYRGLSAFGAGSILLRTDPFRVVLELPFANGVRGAGDGFEVSPDWRPTESWRLSASYSYLRLDLRNEPGNEDHASVAKDEGSSPRHQASLQSHFDLGNRWELDQIVRYVSSLPARGVKAYTTFDLRIGWRAGPWQVALSGRNLADAGHAEFGHDPPPIVELGRSALATVTWSR